MTDTASVLGASPALPLPWLADPLKQASSLRGHALLVLGGEGRGLFELAMHWAHQTLCSASVAAMRPCGACADCRLLAAQTHPDLTVLMPAARRQALGWRPAKEDEEGKETSSSKGKKPSEDIVVDDLRKAIDWGTKSPSRGANKVLVVHPASAMNTVTANALLKTLEEPSASLRLMLTAKATTDLLPTIASRCQHVLVPQPTQSVAERWLAEQGVNDAGVLLRAAGGEPLLARDAVGRGLTAAWWRQFPKAMRLGQASVLAGWTVPHAVDALQKLCHDAMALAAGAPPRYFDAKDFSGTPAWDALRRWSQLLTNMARVGDHPWHAGLALDALVSQASHALQEVRPPSLPGGPGAAGRGAALVRRLGTLPPR